MSQSTTTACPASAEAALSEIVGAIISPGIGIARVGDSRDDFFIGPEAPGLVPIPPGGYKDRQGCVKRQGARFRVYGVDAGGQVVCEITAAMAEIEWTVHLANRKAAWYQFEDRYHFCPEPPDVNPDYDPTYQPVRAPGQYTSLRNQTVTDRSSLVIDPGPRTIKGRSTSGSAYHFGTGAFRGRKVPLGDLRTDESGRLIVLGGFGYSASIAPNNPLKTSFNNDNWHDDISDGPVRATVRFADNRVIEATPARVVVSPPKYAPAIAPIVSLYDRIGPASGAPQDLTRRPSFTRDIYPILNSASEMRWVSVAAHRGHGAGAGGDFINQSTLPTLASNGPEAAGLRQSVFSRVRNPNLPPDSDAARNQAYLAFMPQLSGDATGATQGDPRTFLSLSVAQYALLEKWAAGDFDADWEPGKVTSPEPRPLEEYPVAEQPGALTRAALEPCVGGGFHPGIEITYICEHSDLYAAPFRFRDDLEPGGVTKYMALPWQGDFFSCMQWWWPSQRPEAVVTESQFNLVMGEEVLKSGPMGEPSPAEVVIGPPGPDNTDAAERADAALADRVPWERGLSGYCDPDETYAHNPSRQSMMQMENAMVALWSELGFVTPAKYAGGRPVYVERSRAAMVGIDARELYFRLQNIDQYPEARTRAKWFVEHYLKRAAELEKDPHFPEAWHSFKYSSEAFSARLQQIYNDLVIEGRRYDPANDPLFKTKSDVVFWLTQMAPFNQNDGAWIRSLTPAGPLSEVDSLMFSVWMDEVGDGVQVQAHSNLYTELLHSLGVSPPNVRSRDYAQDDRFLDSAFVGPALALAAASQPTTFYPEILGFSLQIEWTVLGIRPAVDLLTYFGIDPKYYVLHIGIDNAAAGHGIRVRRAIELYLDQQRQMGGEEAVQEQFRRIWNGFVCFGTAGTLGQDVANYLLNKPTPADQVAAIVTRKQKFGSLNHNNKAIGSEYINDLFENPTVFMNQLVAAGYICPGQVEASPFFKLASFDGPMCGVFSDEELETFRRWTLWLKDGDSPPVTDWAGAMAATIKTLALIQQGESAHAANRLSGKSPIPPYDTVNEPVAWWFSNIGRPNGLIAFMRALADPANGVITPSQPDASPFLTQLLSSQTTMGQAFNQPAPGQGGLTFREIALGWIKDGCPTPLADVGPPRRVGLFTGHHGSGPTIAPRVHGMGNIH
jgi:hypothetical protein